MYDAMPKQLIKPNLRDYWLEWSIAKLSDKESLETYGYRIVRESQHKLNTNTCAVPLLWVKELLEQHETNLLHILRTPHHRPRDPHELVRFIKKLGKFLA